MYQRILVPVDNSASSKVMLAEVARFAKLCPSATIKLVHVVDLAPATSSETEFMSPSAITDVENAIKRSGSEVLDTAVAQAKAAGLAPEAAVLEIYGQQLASAIVDESKNWNADIIIMGTHGYSGLSHLLMGSVAEGVVRHATVPVLLVHTRG